MRALRHPALQGLLFVLASSALAHVVPAHFIVRQRYEISGTLPPAAGAPRRVAGEAEAAFAQAGAATRSGGEVRCALTGEPRSRLECSARLSSWRAARAADRILRAALPKELGWVGAAALDERIRKNRSEADGAHREAAEAERLLAEMLKTAAADDSRIDGIAKTRQSLEGEIDNRSRQLEILDEALATGRAGATLAVFKAKRAEVAGTIEALRLRIQEAEEELREASAPRVKRQELEERLSSLRHTIDLSQARIAAYDAVRRAEPRAELFPDPETFRIQPLDEAGTVRAVRDFRHLPFSVPLGLAVFFLLRRWRPSWLGSDTFRSAEEAEALLGLRLIGRIRG